MRKHLRDCFQRTNQRRAAQPATVEASDDRNRVEGYAPDLKIFARLDGRLRKNKRAAKELERTSWGRAVLPMARRMLREFWDEQCDASIYREYTNQGRWILKRRGTWTVWHRRRGVVPADFYRGCEEIKRILAEDRKPGRPSKARFHDMVAACALRYRAEYRGLRVPDYGPLARFLELPEFGYSLSAHRVSEIANEVVRSFAPGYGPAPYPEALEVCGRVAKVLKLQHTMHRRRQIESTEKPQPEV